MWKSISLGVMSKFRSARGSPSNILPRLLAARSIRHLICGVPLCRRTECLEQKPAKIGQNARANSPFLSVWMSLRVCVYVCMCGMQARWERKVEEKRATRIFMRTPLVTHSQQQHTFFRIRMCGPHLPFQLTTSCFAFIFTLFILSLLWGLSSVVFFFFSFCAYDYFRSGCNASFFCCVLLLAIDFLRCCDTVCNFIIVIIIWRTFVVGIIWWLITV